MLVENYAGRFRELAHRHGMRLSIEAYDGCPCDEMTYGGQADEPMAEFWSWKKFDAAYSCTEMSSAAHVYGKRIVGGRGLHGHRQREMAGPPRQHQGPGRLGLLRGDQPLRVPPLRHAALARRAAWHVDGTLGPALRTDANLVGAIRPGTNIWPGASSSSAKDCSWPTFCYLQPEGAPRRFSPPPGAMSPSSYRSGYNFDGCTSEVVMTRMSVKDGRIVLPGGMSYRLLVLPEAETMTPALAAEDQGVGPGRGNGGGPFAARPSRRALPATPPATTS